MKRFEIKIVKGQGHFDYMILDYHKLGLFLCDYLKTGSYKNIVIREYKGF